MRPMALLVSALCAGPALLACSDYKLSGGADVGGGDFPAIAVTPSAISAVTCPSSDRTVSVSNEGGADLEVAAVILEGEGWSTDADTSGFTLAPGEGRVFTLTGTEGSGSLRFESDDPDEPVVRVPLEATPDAPPVVSISSPADRAVLDVSGAVTLRGAVADDFDAAEALAITWQSSADGVIGTDPAAPDGEVQASWAFADRSPGEQVITLSAVDSCGNRASDALTVCQQAGYSSDELDIGAWHFEGVARWSEADDWLELTPAVEYAVGSAFATDTEVSGASVQIRFSFYIGDGTGADGISLTALDTERMSGFLGGTGCGIGYGDDGADCTDGPALPGWSIEVDTYYNEGQDPTEEDHLMFTFDGALDSSLVWVPLPEMEDTGWHELEVLVEAPRVIVRIDGISYIDQDIEGNFDFPAYVGFTAATGGLTNAHLIRSLEVTDYACE